MHPVKKQAFMTMHVICHADCSTTKFVPLGEVQKYRFQALTAQQLATITMTLLTF